MKLCLTEELWQEGEMFVSYCPELDIASCGDTFISAKKNLKEAIEINIEESKKMGTFEQFLANCGFDINANEELSLKKQLLKFERLELAI